MISFREDLQKLVDRGCSAPDCDHKEDVYGVIFLHPSCHPRAGLEVAYLANVGTLEMRCNQCKSHIVTVLVPFSLYPRIETPAKPRAKAKTKDYTKAA